MSLSGPAGAEEEERRAIIEQHARPWMITAYVLTAIGFAVICFGPHVALDEYSPLRLGTIVISLVGTACFLVIVSFRYPESTQGNEFRAGIAMVGGIAVTGVSLSFAGLFDADLYVLGTQAAARWLTQWEGGWGESFVAGILSFVPALPVVGLLGYLFNADPSFHPSPHPISKKRQHADRSASGALPSGGEGGMKIFAKGVVIFGILGALFVGLIGFGGIVDNMNRNFAPGVIAMAISAAVIVLAGGFLLRNSK